MRANVQHVLRTVSVSALACQHTHAHTHIDIEVCQPFTQRHTCMYLHRHVHVYTRVHGCTLTHQTQEADMCSIHTHTYLEVCLGTATPPNAASALVAPTHTYTSHIHTKMGHTPRHCGYHCCGDSLHSRLCLSDWHHARLVHVCALRVLCVCLGCASMCLHVRVCMYVCFVMHVCVCMCVRTCAGPSRW